MWNRIFKLGYTPSDLNIDLARKIWNGKLGVQYGDMAKLAGTEAYGYYDASDPSLINLSQNLVGPGKESSAQLAAVLAHEGTHVSGNRYEVLAHRQALGTYDSLLRSFDLNGNGEFTRQMVSGLADPRSYQGNEGGRDYWRLLDNGSLENDGDGWLRDVNNNYILNKEGNRIGSTGAEAGLLDIFGMSDTAENRSIAVAMMQGADMTEKGAGVWWNHTGNIGKTISISNAQYRSLYDARLAQHNPANIYNALVASGNMDLNPDYKANTSSWWYKGLSSVGLGGIADSFAGSKCISYEQYKANNFIQGMPVVDIRTPIAEGSEISALFGAMGDASKYPHRGIDFAVVGANVYPIFTNDTTIARVFESSIALLSPQGRHVDITTDVAYTFKGEQRTDQVTQRMLHLASSAVVDRELVTINSLLGTSGNTGSWNGSGFPSHLHSEISVNQNRSPWLDQLARNYASRIMPSYSYSGDKRVYYDPLIFLNRYNYSIRNDAYLYNR